MADRMAAMLLLIFGPLLGGIFFGLLQLAVYQVLKAAGVIKEDQIPFFGMLLFRGLLLSLATILIFTIISKKDVPLEEDPWLHPDARESIRNMKETGFEAE